MTRRHWWQRVGDAFVSFVETLTHGLDEASNESVPEPSPPKQKPPKPPGAPGPFANHGPYPANWDKQTRDLWDTEPNTYRDLYNKDEWEDLQEAFWYGWIVTGLTKDEHEAWRERFYDISGVTPSSFDWESFREYWAERGSPTVSSR